MVFYNLAQHLSHLCGVLLALFSIALGGHTGGEKIDADERRVLEHLCEAGAAAYEHLRAAAIISDANALRAENELLRHDTALLRDIAAGRAAAAE